MCPESSDAVATTRLAPSPTGALHLGNARTFLINWALARQRGWRIILRIEDLDTPRVKPGAIDQTIALLDWLGLDWDEGPTIQSDDLVPYRAAMESLARSGLVYPCALTRSQIEQAASAPHEEDHEVRFDPALRPTVRPSRFDHRDINWRLVVNPGAVTVNDHVLGESHLDPSRSVGDFVVWTRRGLPAYQLAVVVDDARQGVTRIVRGDDLLDSTARQMLVRRALGIEVEPQTWHLPLVRGADGRRLAKRHGDTRLDHYRAHGVSPERIVGLLALWCGIVADRAKCEPMTAPDFAGAFDLSTMPGADIIFTPEDDKWLTAN